MKGLNVSDSTTPAGTPAAGGPFPGIRRRFAALAGEIRCEECATELDPEAVKCRACSQRRRHRAGLESVIESYGSERPWVTVHRSDDYDGTTGPTPEIDEEPEGWPW